MFHLTFNHDLNKFETFLCRLMEFLFFPRQYLPEFYRGTYRPVQNLPGISMHDAGPGGHGGCMKCMLSDA